MSNVFPKIEQSKMHLMKECSYLPDNAFLLSTKKGQGHGRQRLDYDERKNSTCVNTFMSCCSVRDIDHLFQILIVGRIFLLLSMP